MKSKSKILYKKFINIFSKVIIIAVIIIGLYSLKKGELYSQLFALMAFIAALIGTHLKSNNYDVILHNKKRTILDPNFYDFNFDSSPYISPLIIRDLICPLAERGTQVSSISILNAQNSNKYCCKPDNTKEYISITDSEGYFGYKYQGTSSNGIHVLLTVESGGGSGIFYSLLFLIFEEDFELTFENYSPQKTQRICITKLSEIPLGDRFNGKIKMKGNKLFLKPGVPQRGIFQENPNGLKLLLKN